MYRDIIPTALPDPLQPVLVPKDSITTFELAVGVGEIIDLSVAHIAPVQDHSLRAWVSIVPGDTPVVLYPAAVSVWNPNRLSLPEIITVYDSALATPDAQKPLPLAPGTYTLNVENLISATNAFLISLTVRT